MIHPSEYDKIDGEDYRFVNETRETYAEQNSGPFALAAAQELNLPLVIFVDQDHGIHFVANKIDDDFFFTAAGPLNTMQVWGLKGEQLLPIQVTPKFVTNTLSITENEIEEAVESVQRLNRIITSKIYN